MESHAVPAEVSTTPKLIQVEKHPLPFVLVTPGHHPARTGDGYQFMCTSDVGGQEQILRILNFYISGPCVVDFETRGVRAWDPECDVVGIGLAWCDGSIYIPYSELDGYTQRQIWFWFSNYKPGFIAHNMYFDYSWIHRHLQQRGFEDAELVWCTYGLLYQTANEGMTGQKWGLKWAQTELLGWAETNETELLEWLVANGWVKGNGKAEKGEMWRAPHSILGKYCLLDVESTWQLLDKVLLPVVRDFPAIQSYHQTQFLGLVRQLVRQNKAGIQLDIPNLRNHAQTLRLRADEVEEKFRSHPEVAQHIRDIEDERNSQFMNSEPPKYKVRHLPKEPAQLKKDGCVSKSWLKWRERMNILAETPPEVRSDWTSWERRRLQEADSRKFNVQSGLDIRDLFITRLGKPVLQLTASGQPDLGEDILKQYGEAAQLLIEYRLTNKELGYVDSYLSLADSSGVLHPSWRVPGTVTGRLAGTEPNLQQVPKTEGVLANFIPRPGTVWIDYDFAALEQVVLAELSQDKALLDIYGPTAKANDVYLYVGAQLPVIGPQITATGYDPHNPTKEGIANAKKLAKVARGIAKTVVLASSYGAGWRKIQKTLLLNGVKLRDEEAQAIHSGYWALFAGVRSYGEQLTETWRVNGGWVLNGLGRPMCVPEDYIKDITNRVVQSTGHDLLMRYISILADELHQSGIPYTPIVADWHDQTIIEVREEYADIVVGICEGVAIRRLNQEVGGSIPLKVDGGIRRDMGEAKLENYKRVT